jgi:Peptidase_C39 like family
LSRARQPSRQARLAAGLWIGLAAGLSGCADWRQWQAGSPQAEALLARPPVGLPERVLLQGVPFFPQEEAQCGPAALATALGHQGVDVSPQALRDQVFTPAREGSFQVEMLAAARRQGRLAVRVAPRLDALLRELAEGRPVVVLLNPALAAWPRWHHAVVVGHDLRAGTVTLRSGAEREAVWPLRSFDFSWARSGRWGFVLSPPAEPPATAGRDELVEAVLGLARAQPPAVARSAYQAALARWPADRVLTLGLAQTWADERAWPQAIATLQQAVAQGGGAVALNNLAMTLWQAGDAPQARRVADEALARARGAEPAWLGAVEDTWRHVQGPAPVSP